MKKIIGVIACGLFLNAAAASSQVTDKEKVQMEKRIEKLIKKMTLEEKVGLLHGNSKFYVAGVERLGIPEWSLSDGPHGVRAEINRHDWAYAGWTNDSASYFPTGTAFAAAWNPELAYRRGEVLGEEARWRKKDVFKWHNPRLHRYNKIAYMHNTGKWLNVPLPKAKPTSGETLAKAMLTMQLKYDVEFVFCRPEDAGAKVLELLQGKECW